MEVLLMAQKQIVLLGDILASFEKELNRAKRSLKTKLSEEEVENICQLKIELTKTEIELENRLEVKAGISLRKIIPKPMIATTKRLAKNILRGNGWFCSLGAVGLALFWEDF
ncbi:6816_t:CDS:2 [Funneliformis geosporum]|uniref:6816_t:CDS:1 n=1 Tax=Funneliformis geosporum TaxID=1117311 RepID=A0A9W4SBU7_9GLOM|nr:6816_t:CDS:2 [Funneliformis geosporum]